MKITKVLSSFLLMVSCAPVSPQNNVESSTLASSVPSIASSPKPSSSVSVASPKPSSTPLLESSPSVMPSPKQTAKLPSVSPTPSVVSTPTLSTQQNVASSKSLIACSNQIFLPNKERFNIQSINAFTVTPDGKFLYLIVNRSDLIKLSRETGFQHIVNKVKIGSGGSFNKIVYKKNIIYFATSNTLKRLDENGKIENVLGENQVDIGNIFDFIISEDDTFYVADESKGSILSFNDKTGVLKALIGPVSVNTPSDNGYSLDGSLENNFVNTPSGLYLEEDKQVLIVSDGLNRIRQIDLNKKKINTLTGTTTSGYRDGKENALFHNPLGLVKLNSTYYVVDSFNNVIRKISSDGTVSTVLGDPLSDNNHCREFTEDCQLDGVGKKGTLHLPSELKRDDSGKLYVQDSCRISEVSLVEGSYDES